MKTLSYIQLQEKYGGKFIAKSNGQVVASGLTYKSLISKITKKRLKRDNLIFAYIHPKGAICVLRKLFLPLLNNPPTYHFSIDYSL